MGLGRIFNRSLDPAEVASRVGFAGTGFETILEAAMNTGNTISGVSEIQTYHGGMSIPGAWRASNIIADLIGSVPWSAYRSHGRDFQEEIEPCPPLLDQPAPPDVRMTTFFSWALDLIWHGNAFGVIAARDGNGTPTAVLPIPAPWVLVRRKNMMDYSPLPVGAIEYWVAGEHFEASDVIHIKGPCAPGALRGFGVLEAHLWDTLRLAHAQRKQAHSISEHGVPTGIINVTNPDATKEDLQSVKDSWLQSQRQRSVAVLNSTTAFQPLSWNPEELELTESRKFTLTEMALIFGLPAYFLGAATESRTYANVEQEGLNLLKYSMSGHLARFEQTLSLAFPRGTVVKADLDSLLRSDTLSRYSSYKLALDSGWMLKSEVRERETLKPIPGIDDKPKPQEIPIAPQTGPSNDNGAGNPNDPGTDPGAPAPGPSDGPTAPEL